MAFTALRAVQSARPLTHRFDYVSESEKAAIKARKLEAERIINKPYIFTDALASRGVYLHRSISLSSFLRGPVTY